MFRYAGKSAESVPPFLFFRVPLCTIKAGNSEKRLLLPQFEGVLKGCVDVRADFQDNIFKIIP